tara:strand:+ start:115 stop:603 length:489 start_codon:yes stop_codon:yes gene_type:complete
MEKQVSFRFTSDCLDELVSSNQSPREVADQIIGVGHIDLFNMSEDTTILGRTKYVAFGEENCSTIKTGIKLALPEDVIGILSGTEELNNTGVIVRQNIFFHGNTNEVLVSFLNLGEKDVVLKKGFRVPAKIIFVSSAKSIDVVSDLEYLDKTAVDQQNSENQ